MSQANSRTGSRPGENMISPRGTGTTAPHPPKKAETSDFPQCFGRRSPGKVTSGVYDTLCTGRNRGSNA